MKDTTIVSGPSHNGALEEIKMGKLLTSWASVIIFIITIMLLVMGGFLSRILP